MKQGDVYWHTFRAPDKRRPVLILTRNSAITFLNGITVAPITTTIRVIPSEVTLTPQQNSVFAECAVTADNIQNSSLRLSLPPGARAMLADHLLESLDGPNQKQIDAAWAEEVERRIREIEECRVETIDGELVMQELRSRFNR